MNTTIVFDVETTGLNFHTDELLSLTLLVDNGKNTQVHIYTPKECSDIPFFFSDLFRRNPDALFIAHNIKFDLHFLKVQPDIVDKMKILDTTVMHQFLHPREPNTLEDIEIRLLGTNKKKEFTDRYGKNFSEWPQKALNEYSTNDVIVTYKITKMLSHFKIPDNFLLFQHNLIKTLYRIEHFGFPYSEEESVALKGQLEAKRDREIYEEIVSLLENDYSIPNPRNINFNSSKQLSKLLYHTLGIDKPDRAYFPPGKAFDKLFTSTLTNKDLLKTINHPFVTSFLSWKELNSTITFLETYRKVSFKGRVHPSFNVTGTITGRLSCSKPNLQNISKKEVEGLSIRFLFRPEPGETLVSIDYQQQEIRMLAVLSQDENLLQLCKSGHDMHAEVGAFIHRRKINDEERKIVKNIHFG